MTDSNVPVRVGACLCPGAPHPDGDFVYLRPKLGLAAGVIVHRLVRGAGAAGMNDAELTGALAEAFLTQGVASWNLTADGGSAIPVTLDAIRTHLLDDFARSADVADAADELYTGPVLGPLVQRAAELLSSTTTNGQTSATPTGSRKPRKRSKRSSTSTTPTADIEPTSK